MPAAPPEGSPLAMAEKCLQTMKKDLQLVEKLDDYLAGRHAPVYIPDNADAEFISIAKRSPLNMIPLVINSVTQVCYVDAIRHSVALDATQSEVPEATLPPEMEAWQRNRMDARQLPIVRALASHGMVYTLTVRDPRNGKARFEGYTAAKACALYDDPLNDIDPAWGMVIKKGNCTNFVQGHLYGETDWWIVTQGNAGLEVQEQGPHGMSTCPLSRGVIHMDLEGRPSGLIEPIIDTQDQVNQTSFDTLTVQSWGSFNVRTATGMALPVRRWTRPEIDQMWPDPGPDASAEDHARYQEPPNVGDPILDQDGQEIPLPVSVSQKRFLVAEDADTKFGTLQATDLRPFLTALDARIKYLAALSQTPPTYFMGELANLSAEALQAAEVSKTRRDSEIRMALAEMYERMLQLAMELEGHPERAADEGTEIKWADSDPRSLASTADALGKMAEMLDVPPSALWEDIPGMTQGKLVHWMQLKKSWDAAHPEVELSRKLDEADVYGTLNDYSTYEQATT